jgi:hypothetical protein
VTTVGSGTSRRSSVSEDALGGWLVVVSSGPVASREVGSGVVDSEGPPSLLGSPAKIVPSWATDTPAITDNKSTRVVRTIARYTVTPRLRIQRGVTVAGTRPEAF